MGCLEDTFLISRSLIGLNEWFLSIPCREFEISFQLVYILLWVLTHDLLFFQDFTSFLLGPWLSLSAFLHQTNTLLDALGILLRMSCSESHDCSWLGYTFVKSLVLLCPGNLLDVYAIVGYNVSIWFFLHSSTNVLGGE